MAGTTRVLQVDDEPDFLEMSATLLERATEDVEVETATSGEAALDVLAETHVDCVVSDYDMPGMDGLGLLREVRERYPNTPFILLTARGSEAVASEAISAGVDDYLQKGGGDEQYQLLANRVRNLVRQAHAETSYREIFENATVGLTVRDKDTGELIDANERYCELLGYTKAELLNLEFEDLGVAEEGFTRERALEHIRAAGHDGVETFEWLDHTKDGDRLWVEISLRRAEIEGVERVLASVRDITERKAHEQDLAETREYYETVAANLPTSSVAIFDRDLVYKFVDGGAFEAVEIDASDFEGRPFESVHTDAYVEQTREDYEATLDGESRSYEFAYEDRTFLAHTVPVTDGDEEIIAGLLVARDVTDEREREQRMAAVTDLLAEDLHDQLSVASDAVARAIDSGETGSLDDVREVLARTMEITEDAIALSDGRDPD